MKKVKNISGKTLSIIGVGTVKNDETISVPDDFNNANFVGASKSEERRKGVQKNAQKEIINNDNE